MHLQCIYNSINLIGMVSGSIYPTVFNDTVLSGGEYVVLDHATDPRVCAFQIVRCTKRRLPCLEGCMRRMVLTGYF